jgi:hypothetical protein
VRAEGGSLSQRDVGCGGRALDGARKRGRRGDWVVWFWGESGGRELEQGGRLTWRRTGVGMAGGAPALQEEGRGFS